MKFHVLFSSPGAGLGHLTRAAALCLELRDLGLMSLIVSDSPYGKAFSSLTGCPVVSITPSRWRTAFPDFIRQWGGSLVVLDSFPWGLRGEWKDGYGKGIRFLYTARRMKWERYVEAMAPGRSRAGPSGVIVLEPLSPDHEGWIRGLGSPILRLAARVRLPELRKTPPVHPELAIRLKSGDLGLVVHSGPQSETSSLVQAAEKEMKARGVRDLALVTPRPVNACRWPWFEYFPASRLFENAGLLVTAAGYNSIAETASYAHKHLAIPFERRYDDQRGRLDHRMPAAADAEKIAARWIASFL